MFDFIERWYGYVHTSAYRFIFYLLFLATLFTKTSAPLTFTLVACVILDFLVSLVMLVAPMFEPKKRDVEDEVS